MQHYVDIVERAYDVTEPDDSWLADLAESTHSLWGGGNVLRYIFNMGPAEGLRYQQLQCSGSTEKVLTLPSVLEKTAGVDFMRRVYMNGPVQVASETFDELGLPSSTWQPLVAPYVDCMGMIATSMDGSGVLIGAFYDTPIKPTLRTRHAMARIAAHVGAAHRLRKALRVGSSESGVDISQSDGILDPDGSVQHAQGELKHRTRQELLQYAVRQRERARGPLRREEPSQALDLWEALVAGRWSLVDHFDSDGRRYLLVVKNPPDVPEPRALTPRERQVLSYSALGHSVKLIAYELGVSSASVSTTLKRGMRKVGVSSRFELVRLLGASWQNATPLSSC